MKGPTLLMPTRRGGRMLAVLCFGGGITFLTISTFSTSDASSSLLLDTHASFREQQPFLNALTRPQPIDIVPAIDIFPPTLDIPSPEPESAVDVYPPPATLGLDDPLSPLREIDDLFPVAKEGDEAWVALNRRTAEGFVKCLRNGDDCRAENQRKLVILGSYHFGGALLNWNGGEDVWGRSVILAMKSLNYTWVYARNLSHTTQIYARFPDETRAVLLEQPEVEQCATTLTGPWDPAPSAPQINYTNCVKTHSNPNGIPLWKIFAFFFWNHAISPLGGNWTMSPELYENPQSMYIGYSVEPSCRPSEIWDMYAPEMVELGSKAFNESSASDIGGRYIPPEKRPSPPRAYLFAKVWQFFTPKKETAWWRDIYDRAASEAGVQYYLSAGEGENERGLAEKARTEGALPKAESIVDGPYGIGRVSQDEFVQRVSSSYALVGVGMPYISPTPYEALCLGVPFINPLGSIDDDNPNDRSQWRAQHDALKYLDPPYVYNVLHYDANGFVDAIKSAIKNPIPGYILPRMSIKLIAEKMRDLVIERDSESMARVIFEQWKEEGKEVMWLM